MPLVFVRYRIFEADMPWMMLLAVEQRRYLPTDMHYLCCLLLSNIVCQKHTSLVYFLTDVYNL